MIKKVMLITGASRGIGAATATLAAERGWAVCLNYLQNHQAAEAVLQSIQDKGGQAMAVAADVSRESEVQRLFASLDKEFGRLDALVNNAGILETQQKVSAIDTGRLERVFRANVFSSFFCAREAVLRMSTRQGGNGGAIVNVSSGAARSGSPNEYVDYAAAKGAIDSFTRGLALEVASEGIRVNGVRPGLIYTDIHSDGGEPGRVDRLKEALPLGRGGRPEEVAEAILWLASDRASFSTGTFIDTTGGL